jgi:hypothetical protein
MDFEEMTGAKARHWKNKFIVTLPEVYKRRLYKKRGYCSIYEFAAKLGGVSHNVVDQTLRVFEKVKDLPEIKNKIESHGIHKVRVVSNIANEKTDKYWADNIEKMSKSALEIKARDFRNSDPGIGSIDAQSAQEQAKINLSKQPPKTSNMSSSRERFGMDLDPETILQLKLIKQKFEKEKGEKLCWNETIKMAAKKLLTEEPVRKYKQRPHKSRGVPAKQRRETLAESGGLCSIPGCNKPATEIHHIKPWSIFRSHEDLEPICKGHHELRHQSDNTIDKKFRIYKMREASCC